MYRFPHRTVFALFLCALCLAPSSLLATQDTQGEIVMPEGTAISVVTAHDVTSKEAKPNDPVNFTVNEDLVIDGQVVVRKERRPSAASSIPRRAVISESLASLGFRSSRPKQLMTNR